MTPCGDVYLSVGSALGLLHIHDESKTQRPWGPGMGMSPRGKPDIHYLLDCRLVWSGTGGVAVEGGRGIRHR